MRKPWERVARETGLEPATSGVTGREPEKGFKYCLSFPPANLVLKFRIVETVVLTTISLSLLPIRTDLESAAVTPMADRQLSGLSRIAPIALPSALSAFHSISAVLQILLNS